MEDGEAEYLEAEKAWDALETVEPGWAYEKSEISKYDSTPLITGDQLLDFFHKNPDVLDRGSSMEEEEEDSNSNNLSTRIQCFFNRCIRKRDKLANRELEEQKSLIFNVTKTQFSEENPIYFRVLLTLYKQLTGHLFDVARYGSHWEEIGFQGSDPSTDLRGVGLLGLVQPLYMVTTPKLLPMCLRFYRLSLSETQNFPFLVLSLNVTRISFSALRDGLLNRLCNQEKDAWKAINSFYSAVMFQVYYEWKTKGKTIKDSGYVLKDAEFYCRKNVKACLMELESHIQSAYSENEIRIAEENIRKKSKEKEEHSIP